jgi:dephospho-CoA kinase
MPRVIARVIGLTGGIASGKSTVAAILRELGVPVVDADVVAREVVAKGEPALAEIAAQFGPEVLLAYGSLDRAALGRKVFADPAQRRQLEAITHPRIAERARRDLVAHLAAGAALVFYEAALIVERGLHQAEPALLDGLWVVASPPELQLARLLRRDGLDTASARQRLAAQAPLADKLAAATRIIENSGNTDELRAAVVRALDEEARAGTPTLTR